MRSKALYQRLQTAFRRNAATVRISGCSGASVKRRLLSTSIAMMVTAAIVGCVTEPARPVPPTATTVMRVTGYCPCGECCNWTRNLFFQPVCKSGPYKGRPKKVGITASGTKAQLGTIAADTSRYPFGTIMYVEGYGYGRVEDTGSEIKGDHIDLFFESHKEADQWGSHRLRVSVWLPATDKRLASSH